MGDAGQSPDSRAPADSAALVRGGAGLQGSRLRTSQLICRELVEEGAGPRGYRSLLARGYLVRLAPGLSSGLPLFQRTLERLIRRCRRSLLALGAQEVSLPACEGGALINLLLHGGAAGRDDALGGFAVGAGFRHDGPRPRGLYDMPLYQRLDAALIAGAETSCGRQLREFVDDLADSLELSPVWADAADEEQQQLSLGDEVVGRLRCSAIEGTERGLSLLSLDLSALLGVVADVHGDQDGLAWPPWLAPFDVGLAVVDQGSRVACELAEKLSVDLLQAGLEVLIDDRPLDAASRRASLTAWGLPLRVLLGPTAEQGEVLLEQRREPGPPRRVPVAELLARVQSALGRVPDNASRARRRRRANH